MAKEQLLSLPPCDLRELAAALKSGRLSAPFSRSGVERFLSAAAADAVAFDLQSFADSGMSAANLASSLELLADGLANRPRLENLVELVTTGPDGAGNVNRETSVVVRDLFHAAQESVLVAGYAVYQGQRVFLPQR